MEDFVQDEDERGGSAVEDLLDEVLPEELDWERLVRTYPLPALALAALGGFVLGLRHGPEILSAVSNYAASEMSRNVGEVLGRQGL
jgi:hypothetical protein